MAYTLRPYQSACVEAVYGHLRYQDTNPCAVLPTGAGKTLVIAQIVRDAVERWHGRVCILAHVKELLQQAADKITAYAPSVDVGIYSAGLKSRQHDAACVIAGIQSVYQRACDMGAFNLIIVDEAHLIPASGEGMYRTFIADAKKVNPKVRIIGLTATPYRTDVGSNCGPNNILQKVCYDAGVRPLIEDGYLSRLTTKATAQRMSVDGVGIRGGEYIAGDLARMADNAALIHATVAEMISKTLDRHSVLIFCSGVEHAEHVRAEIQRQIPSIGVDVTGLITGDTPADERAATIAAFAARDIKYLANVNVLTTGFDAPNVDCVVLLRPTLSPGLYYQMVGRGLRLHPGKDDCLILDFAGNALRHGPIDAIVPEGRGGGMPGDSKPSDAQPRGKKCPECGEIADAWALECPACGHEYPEPEMVVKHDTRADEEAQVLSETDILEVDSVVMQRWQKRIKSPEDEGKPDTVRVDYMLGFACVGSEWVCPEHTGFARQKFEAWWRRRSPCEPPTTVQEVLEHHDAQCLAEPRQIISMPEGKYKRVMGDKFTEILEKEDIADRLCRLYYGGDDSGADADSKPVGVDEDEILF